MSRSPYEVERGMIGAAATIWLVVSVKTFVPAPVSPIAAPPAEPVAVHDDDGFDDVGLMVADPCGQDPLEIGPACADRRQIYIDYDALGIDQMLGGEVISYDYDEVTRAVAYDDFGSEPEISLAVRLIVSEVGADRLITSRNGLLEGIGILYTVDNRMDPTVFNVENRPNAPTFPGCGVGATFAECANASQYLGMSTWRATDPQRHYDADVLAAAVDVAVTAWWLQEHHYVADITEGATNYVHRCGGAAYGMVTGHCDAHIGNSARDDVPGANPFTGPIVFKGPVTWSERQGFYPIRECHRFDYDPWFDLAAVPDEDDALADAEGAGDDLALRWVLVPRAATFEPNPIASDSPEVTLVNGVGPVQDGDVLDRLASWQATGRW
jgi:hypothetical protein